MSAHTPGPWEVRTTHSDEVTRYVRMPDGTKVVVSCLPLPVSEKEDANARANVRLIAAAPELLKALSDLLEWEDRDAAGALDPEWRREPLVEAARAAIAKAEGQS